MLEAAAASADQLLVGVPRPPLTWLGSPAQIRRIDGWRFGPDIAIRRVRQLLKILPGFMRPVESSFAACILDHVANDRLFLAGAGVFHMPQLNAGDRAQ
jgi:hypothetical protein